MEGLFRKENAHAYLRGYWQSEDYFGDVRESLLSGLSFRNLSRASMQLAEEMRACESVSIHIRRGDYTKDKRFADLSGTRYYSDAIRHVESQTTNPQYYLFSDDPAWSAAYLEQMGVKARTVTWNTGADAYQDMYLISRCRHNIIANSSFSWWGAEMNQEGNKLVISPRSWYVSGEKPGETRMVPPSWVRI